MRQCSAFLRPVETSENLVLVPGFGVTHDYVWVEKGTFPDFLHTVHMVLCSIPGKMLRQFDWMHEMRQWWVAQARARAGRTLLERLGALEIGADVRVGVHFVPRL